MKAFRNLLRYLSLILIVGGAAVISVTYVMKKEILQALVNNTIVKSSMSVLRTFAYSFGAVMAGLILLLISMRISSAIRRTEREKRQALKEQQKENDEINRQLKKEAEEAKAEAERAKEEAEQIRLTLDRTRMVESEEATTTEEANTEE